jgi:GT2 family glycosyltransferase
MINKRVVAVIVTYGNRINYVEKVINRLKNIDNICSAIVVENGSSKGLSSDDFVHILRLDENTGSANGYYLGLQEAIKTSSDFIWMLDDDNLPAQNSLDILLSDYEGSDNKTAFSSFRLDRKELKEAGEQKYIRNSFFGFSLKTKIFKNGSQQDKHDKILIPCETVPYGGLLLPLRFVDKIGLPDREYVLYSDDNDYTYRLKKNGIKIFCDTRSIISDLESSWYRRENVPMFHAVFRTKMMRNALYTIRNRSYFELNNIVDSKFEYWLNVFVYLIYVFLFYMPKNREGLGKFNAILRCIKSAKNGNLGEINEKH